MQMQQIRIEFAPEHDRLLMRIASSDSAEVLLWLTRRCIRLMWPLLMKMVASAPRVALQPTPEARQAVLGMERERALANADFASPYRQEARARPLGADPVLISRIDIGRDGHGRHVLTLRPREGQGVNLALDDTVLHSVCKLLQDVVAKAEWDLALTLPAGFAPPTSDGVHRVIN